MWTGGLWMQTWLIVCGSGNNMSKEVSDRPHILISGNGLSLPINITCVRRNALCHLGALWCNEDDIISFFMLYLHTVAIPQYWTFSKTNLRGRAIFKLKWWVLISFPLNGFHTDKEVVLSVSLGRSAGCLSRGHWWAQTNELLIKESEFSLHRANWTQHWLRHSF